MHQQVRGSQAQLDRPAEEAVLARKEGAVRLHQGRRPAQHRSFQREFQRRRSGESAPEGVRGVRLQGHLLPSHAAQERRRRVKYL